MILFEQLLTNHSNDLLYFNTNAVSNHSLKVRNMQQLFRNSVFNWQHWQKIKNFKQINQTVISWKGRVELQKAEKSPT